MSFVTVLYSYDIYDLKHINLRAGKSIRRNITVIMNIMFSLTPHQKSVFFIRPYCTVEKHLKLLTVSCNMTDTYKLLDLGRQILVSLISHVSSLDLKICNVSVYLSLQYFFALYRKHCPQTSNQNGNLVVLSGLPLFSSLNSTNGG